MRHTPTPRDVPDVSMQVEAQNAHRRTRSHLYCWVVVVVVGRGEMSCFAFRLALFSVAICFPGAASVFQDKKSPRYFLYDVVSPVCSLIGVCGAVCGVCGVCGVRYVWCVWSVWCVCGMA